MPSLSVPHSAQRVDGYCLPACIQMALAFLDISASQDDLAKTIGALPYVGAPYSRIKRLVSLGVNVVYSRQGSLQTLRDALNHKLPVILFVQAGELQYWQEHKAQHAIVLIGLDEPAQIVCVLDPAMPPDPISVSLGDLLLAWDEMDNAYAVISRRQ